jgi:hypothetical protein
MEATLILLCALVAAAILWTLYSCQCQKIATITPSPSEDVIEDKPEDIPPVDDTPQSDFSQPQLPPPGETELGISTSCPKYAAPGFYLVQSCDANPYNSLSDRQWATSQDPQDFSYLPATSIPAWTQWSNVNQQPLYDNLNDESAGLDVDFKYQHTLLHDYSSNPQGYTLGDESTTLSVEDLYIDYWKKI